MVPVTSILATSALTVWLAVGLTPDGGRSLRAPDPRPAPTAVEVATASGTFAPVDPVLVLAPAAGTLDDLYVRDGARVKAGELLATIDNGGQLVQVRAPIAGIVEHTESPLGTAVRERKTPLFTLTRTRDVLRLTVELSGSPGAHVIVTTPDQPNRTFEGAVVHVDDDLAVIDVSDPAHHLRPGMTGAVRVNAAF